MTLFNTKNSSSRFVSIEMIWTNLLMFLSTGLFAQITITNATFPVVGDTLRLAIDNSPVGIVPFTPPGPDQVWDYSSLQADATQNIVYRPASQGSQGSNVPGAELFAALSPGTETYFNVTSTSFESQAYWGIQPFDLVANNLFDYLPPLAERRAPLNFFDVNSSSSGFFEIFPPSAFPPSLMINLTLLTSNAPIDSMRYRVAINEISAADGYGTVSIPGGTYDVLREKRTRFTETRIDAKIPPLGWLDFTDICLQAGFSGLGVDTTVTFYFHNDVSKEQIAIVRLNNEQNAVTMAVFKANGTSCPPGNILYVNANATGANNGSSWNDAFRDLQDALSSTCTGITQIWVAEGTYTPGTARTDAFVMKNNLAIYGGFPNTGDPGFGDRNADPATNGTVLSGDIDGDNTLANNSYHVIFNNNNNNNGLNGTAVLDGFTITGGNAESSSQNYSGGGMVNTFSSPTVTNCSFSGNSAVLDGAGMLNEDFSSPTLTNCSFSGNSAAYNGGGIYNSQSSPTLTNCTFSGNSASYGGGMYNDSSWPTLTNCTFSGNSAANNGGGMYNIASFSPTLTNCTFSGNSARYGGGMYNEESSPTLANCSFSGNPATLDGGGMYNSSSSPTLTNCSFSGNPATRDGGGMYNRSDSSPTLANCILWGNSTEIVNINNSNPSVSYSIVQGGYAGTGNLNVNPLFFDQVGGNLRLQACSPAIDTGNDGANATTTDLDGNARKFEAIADGQMIDMGAYEFQATVSIMTYYVDTDGDNYGTGPGQDFCTDPGTGWALQAGDCDDGDANINPAAPEVCDDVDNNCIDGIDENNICCPPANILYVNDDAVASNNDGTSWANAFTSLQSALNSTCLGITQIWVAEGTYTPGTARTDAFVMKNNLAIYGGFPNTGDPVFGDRDADPATNGTVLSGEIGGAGITDNSYTVVIGSGTDNTAILDGFTITAGNADGSITFPLPDSRGGGMYNFAGSPMVTNCLFVENTALFGGGMYNADASPVISNCSFIGNQQTFAGFGGGGIMTERSASPTITQCRFENNHGRSGGGLYFNGTLLTLTDCVFTGNTASLSGGGLFQRTGSQTSLSNCSILNNSAQGFGGGINSFGSMTVLDCIIDGNQAANAGGVSVADGILEMTNTIVSNNQTTFQGSGINIQDSPGSILTNCLIVDNASENSNGGIANYNFFSGISVLTLVNSTVANNTSVAPYTAMWSSGTNPTTNLKNTIVGNNIGGNFYADEGSTLSDFVSLGNNLDSDGSSNFVDGTNGDIVGVDPLFVSAGNYRLQECSPAIDAGTANGAPNNDLDDNTRPVNAAPNRPRDYDMGAYEFQGTVPGPTLVCVDNLTVQLDDNLTATVTAAQIGSSSDGCAPLSFLIDGESSLTFDCDQVGPQTVTLQVTDLFMNVETTSCSFTVADDISFCNSPPVAVCQPVTVNADTNCEAEVAAEAFDGGSTDPDMDMLTFSVSPEGPYGLGTTSVVITVSDGLDMDTCQTTITVVDVNTPIVTCQEFSANFSTCSDAIFPNTPSGVFFPIADLSDFSVSAGEVYMASFDLTTCVTENCSGEGFQSAFVDSYEENRVAGCSVDIINVVTIRDAAGNQAADSIFFRFTLTFDGDPPVITCPEGVNIECGVIPTAVATDASATSGCGTPAITVSDAVINGEPDMAGTTYTFTFTATDGCGKTSTCDQVFTVIDNTPPTIACFNQTINFNGEDNIPLDEDDLVDANDNCGIQSISLSPNSIFSSQVGQTVPVAVTVTDVNGNSETCTSQITVTGLPSGWSQDPNGVGCAAGNNIDYNAGNATWTATSTNCYYTPPFTSDASAFAQYALCGNGSITAQVTGISGTSLGWAGVVMRETNAPGAKKAQLTTNMSNFSRREFRTTTNGTAFPLQFPSQNRRWLRIVRSGNQFAMYVSPNGANWAFAGAQNIQMSSCIEIGLVVSNYTSNSTVTSTFANVSVIGGNQSISAGGLESLSYQDDPIGLRDVKVYPNPTSGQLNIALSGYESRSVTLEVYNTMGQILYIKEIDEVQSGDEIIDLSSVANGMYLIRVSSDGLPAEMKRVTVAR